MANPLACLPGMEADLQRVDVALRSSVRSDDAFLTELASHLVLAGGKRLRPALGLAAARAVGAPVTDDVVQGAVSVELVHLGSLYHDDVIDDAVVRRTVPSVNARWGNLRAILAGDFLLAKASELAADLGAEVAGLLARTISRLCEGEVRELQSAYDVGRSEASYLASIEGKTASLFAASCRIGALVAEAPPASVDALTTFGWRFGRAFQVVDDVLDVVASEEELGKPAGHDLVEGVYTLPVLRALASPEGEELRHLLGRPLDGPEIDKARALVRSSGAVDEALAFARDEVEASVAALAGVGVGVDPMVAALGDAGEALLADPRLAA